MIVDLFAGPGGWDQGLRDLGSTLEPVGIEFDQKVCETRHRAGFHSYCADVSQLDPAGLELTGLIASPPCQDWSSAGRRAGWESDRGRLVAEVPRWVEATRPQWVACEQVRQVAPVWEIYARRLREWGYWTWSGILHGADYGLPQTRPRAILIAHRDRPVFPPAPTHHREGRFGLPLWKAAAEALHPTAGWDNADLYIDGVNARGSGMKRRYGQAPIFPVLRTAPTVISTAILWNLVTKDLEPVRQLTLQDMLALQGFPPDFPIPGTKTHAAQQIADAVPPPLAAAVLSTIIDSP